MRSLCPRASMTEIRTRQKAAIVLPTMHYSWRNFAPNHIIFSPYLKLALLLEEF